MLSCDQLLIGYARVSTANQDLASQGAGLAALGVDEKRVYVDHGLAGTNRERPDSEKPSPPAAKATAWSSPSSTASLARCQTPETSSTNSPTAASGPTSAARSTTPPLRSAGCCPPFCR